MALLNVNGLYKKGNDGFVVDGIHFNQQPFEKIAIAGESGSGKTTLLKMIGGLVQPDGGEILFEGKKVIGPYEKLLPGHPGIAYLSQYFELRNNYRVEEELESGNKLEDDEAKKIYDICQVAHLLKRRTDQLSGGERQRIVLAKLLTGSPRLLLLDEPFSHLDAPHKQAIKNVIREIGEKLRLSCILVSHDAPDMLSWADTILVMKEGSIIQKGRPEEVYQRPVNEYCAGLFGEFNILTVEQAVAMGVIKTGKPEKKDLFLRPEQITISRQEPGLPGKVHRSLYRGNYYMVDVETENGMIRVQASEPFGSPEKRVFLSAGSNQ